MTLCALYSSFSLLIQPKVSLSKLTLFVPYVLKGYTITVIIGPSDYGSIISNDTTDYMPVNVGDNDIHLNSELFLVESFSTSITGNCQQYYTFRFTDGGGYSMNWESELTDWESCMD